ncbi:hypothetical protein TTHERM_00731440 (macronuclear) [Tetrahymena thermophila SB210]|uniref:Uncharacterized protein n=1 Tax=Tetrahymena thermophila (strain SB210) TaxID=312017 RepID=Q245G8_TETTS|nr:hypothetical protein TTHERM_00731440 [Tetrahymena thermophila SB210]EAS03396.1 hypothetical protein TTHERM_00731440 [Tetrahymena thermophila SB210]|eukprot:XP_001023641.1 hypothetical protein TTHERM_00731440 [Tetrahymena thermophila SB210]
MLLSFQQPSSQSQINTQQLKLNTGQTSMFNQTTKQSNAPLSNENNHECYQYNSFQKPNSFTKNQDLNMINHIERSQISKTYQNNDAIHQNQSTFQSVQHAQFNSNRNSSPFFIPQNQNIPIVVQNLDTGIQTLKNNNIQPVQRNRIFSSIVQSNLSTHTRNSSGNQLNLKTASPHFIQQKLVNQSVLVIPQANNNNIQYPTQVHKQIQQQQDQQKYFQSNVKQSNILINQLDQQRIPSNNNLIQSNKKDSDKQQQIIKQIQLLKNIEQQQNHIQISNQKQKKNDSIFQQNDSAFQNEQSYIQEEGQLEDVSKMKSEIDYLNSKLKLKEEEVSIFIQYVNERREFEKEKIFLIQQLEEARAQTQYLKLQQSKNLNSETNDNVELKDQVLINQNEIILLNKEIQSLNKQIQYSEQQIHNKDDNIKELKQKIEEQNILIKKQSEEIQNLNKKLDNQAILNTDKQQIDQIQKQKDLEQQNQVYLLKIQSLERNLVILEKENRALKKQSEEQNNLSAQKL